MSNQYDEIKRLLKNSREMLNSEQVNESRKTLIEKGLIKEMDIKPAILMKAVKVAHKASFTDETDKFDALETILAAVGKDHL